MVEVLLSGHSSLPWHHSAEGTNDGHHDNTAPDPWGRHLAGHSPPHAEISNLAFLNIGVVDISQLAFVDTSITERMYRSL